MTTMTSKRIHSHRILWNSLSLLAAVLVVATVLYLVVWNLTWGASSAWGQSDDLTLYAINDVGTGLYEVDPTDGSTTSVGYLGSGSWDSLTWAGSSLYAIEDTGNDLYQVDPSDASRTLVGDLGTGVWHSLTASGSSLYAIDNTGNDLYQVDPTDGSTTLVGDLGSGNWQALTASGSSLYAIDDNGNDLYEVDPTDGSTTSVGYLGSGSWDSLTASGSSLYVIDDSGNDLYQVDPTDGSTTSVGDLGTGRWQALAASAAAPGAPAAPILTSGDEYLAVSWVTILQNSGFSISDYDIQYRVDSTGDWSDWPFTGNGTSTPIIGLTNGTTYELQVRGESSEGEGDWSSSSTGTPDVNGTGTSGPLAPLAPSISPGDKHLWVTWVVPFDGNSPITGYDVEYRRTGATVWSSWSHTGTTTATTITGLTNGLEYEVRVRAENAVGDSSWSSVSTGTPLIPTTPSAPAAPYVIIGDRQLWVSWNAPADGGSPIAGYEVEYRPVGGAGWSTWAHTGTTTATTITGLTNGLEYEVRVLARNDIGDSPWSVSSRGTPNVIPPGERTVPGTPSPPMVTTSVEQLLVSWGAPANGGSPITGYDVEYRRVGVTVWSTWSHTGTTTATTITGLTNGLEYEVRVRAENAVGDSSWSDSALGVPTPPRPPSRPNPTTLRVGRVGDERLEATWTPPHDGGSPITGYEVRHREVSASTWESSGDIGTRTFSIITGLTTGVTYEVQIRAKNAIGDSAWSLSSEVNVSPLPDPVAGEELFTNQSPVAFTVTSVELETTGERRIEMAWDPVQGASGYVVETRDNGVFLRLTRVSEADFRARSNMVAVIRTPGAPVGNTSKGLTHLIVRVRAYKTFGLIDRYSPWTEGRAVTFPKYEYEVPAGIDLGASDRDVLGVGRLMGEITAPLGFDDTTGRDYIIPLLFAAALAAAGASAWLMSGGGWSASGLIVGALVFILVWGVAGPVWFDVPLALALAPVVLVSLAGLFSARKMVEG